MLEHLTKLQDIQSELYIMWSLVSEDDFADIILTSLSESWNIYILAYLGINSKTTITSHELIAYLLKEERQRKERVGTTDTAMEMKDKKEKGKSIEYYNCKKKGHLKKNC